MVELAPVMLETLSSGFLSAQIPSGCKSTAELWAYPGAWLFPRVIVRPCNNNVGIRQIMDGCLFGQQWVSVRLPVPEGRITPSLLPSCNLSMVQLHR